MNSSREGIAGSLASRGFGQEICGNGREVSVGVRRRPNLNQLPGHLDKVPCKQDRESLAKEHLAESPVGMEIESDPTEQPRDLAEQYE
jgi:hypothetical protein